MNFLKRLAAWFLFLCALVVIFSLAILFTVLWAEYVMKPLFEITGVI